MTKVIQCLVWAMFLLAGPARAGIIKAGSVLDILVTDHPEFSGRYTVGDNGTIDYPLIADQSVVEITTSELMNELTFRLAKHVDNPLVLVKIVKKPEMIVTVLGLVAEPGPVTTYKGASVQEVIQLAGGPAERADLERVKVIHKGLGEENTEFFDLKAFMNTGSINEMPRLAQDDVVILLSEERNRKVKVIGAVTKPGFYALEGKMNIFELIYLAGGPAEKADLSRVRRFSKQDDKTIEEVVNVQAYIDKGEMDSVPLAGEGDLIILYSKWFDWKTFLAVLTNVLLFIVTIQGIRGAVEK